MDETDNKILFYLKKNARMPFLQIAKELKVSEGTVRKRVAKLENEGIIRKFTVKLNNRVGAIIGIETNPHIETKKIVENLRGTGVNETYEVTGRFDIICTLDADNVEQMNNILEKIRALDGINHTETFTILKEN